MKMDAGCESYYIGSEFHRIARDCQDNPLIMVLLRLHPFSRVIYKVMGLQPWAVLKTMYLACSFYFHVFPTFQ